MCLAFKSNLENASSLQISLQIGQFAVTSRIHSMYLNICERFKSKYFGGSFGFVCLGFFIFFFC